LHEVVHGNKQPLTLSGGLLPHVAFSPEATALVVGSRGPFGSFWSVSQSGFDLEPVKAPMTSKLEIVRELVGDDDKPIKKITIGDEISVRIRVRALEGLASNVAIIDLLPAGFEVVMQSAAVTNAESSEASSESAKEGAGEGSSEGEGQSDNAEEQGEGEGDEPEAKPEGSAGSGVLTIALPGSDFALDYADVREDRVVLYGSVGKEMATFLYKIKATNAGKVVVPAAVAESMYDRSIRARGEPSSVSVSKP